VNAQRWGEGRGGGFCGGVSKPKGTPSLKGGRLHLKDRKKEAFGGGIRVASGTASLEGLSPECTKDAAHEREVGTPRKKPIPSRKSRKKEARETLR